ncbi:MAG TPA: peptide chain release factor N(5)-glutamine methyltransferase [Flavobacterium sp.]|uniref:peptide chain release factor N(5)-glutamine methyltransferase n=1 Tax=Flavobacterium sp. TaxID=239 RepID=UPI002C7C55CF|nr:peptide chain release factor N(5)-glutamine methyltransferase [Flavobacterium sp.]HNP32091.1 peptide chain release factor N(5)-glutamine methyltransferase [Flavobacterium sp.]
MQIKNYRDIFKKELQSIYDEQEIDSFFYIVLEKLHNMKRIDLALNPEMVIDGIHLKQWKSIVSELKSQKPIQYILGETEFCGLRFLVNENTLIPRPETEELVELIIKDEGKGKREKGKVQILDVGTGSGCIAISLAKSLSNANLSAIDVSEKALATAQKNAEINEVNVTFLLKNILKTEDLQGQFDIIVSNPPYVRNLEKTEIKPNVLEYEPHLALFVDDTDALLFYRKIGELAKKNLNPNGKLYFEINQYLGKETVQLLEDLGFQNVELKKDIYGNDRMICAYS